MKNCFHLFTFFQKFSVPGKTALGLKSTPLLTKNMYKRHATVKQTVNFRICERHELITDLYFTINFDFMVNLDLTMWAAIRVSVIYANLGL